jgi:hypothetical protein
MKDKDTSIVAKVMVYYNSYYKVPEEIDYNVGIFHATTLGK